MVRVAVVGGEGGRGGGEGGGVVRGRRGWTGMGWDGMVRKRMARRAASRRQLGQCAQSCRADPLLLQLSNCTILLAPHRALYTALASTSVCFPLVSWATRCRAARAAAVWL